MADLLATEKFSDLIPRLLDIGRESDAYLILRFEERRDRSVAVEGERVEAVEASLAGGLGVQAFTTSGHNGFAAVDDPDEERAARAVHRAVAAARAARDAGLEANAAVVRRDPDRGVEVPPVAHPFDRLTVGEVKERTAAFAARAATEANGLTVRTMFTITRGDWRIVRSDGTDVSFSIPRSYLGVGITARKDGEAVRTSAQVSGTSYETLLDEDRAEALLRRVRREAELARDLLEAEPYPAGSYPILVDYALAKGLAHEAFGHAAESDGLDSSILGAEGRFRAGERFGGQNVTIVDESIVGDSAYQPYSGNGVPRRRVEILKNGVLTEALADVHTAGRAGTPVTGSARLQSFANVPLPRMSNIRIEVDEPHLVPEDKEFFEWRPEEVRDLLVESGDLAEGGRIVFLSGYRGGQVNPALGDFVFHSTALYELTPKSVRLFKPGIFSGRIEAALHSIVRGFGPLRLDAAGTCGKAGQGVPSSGGSHHFLLIGENPQVGIGGRS
jgi:TldD protein